MSILTICPCCNDKMLHHLGHRRSYWFCRHCWQEMPDLNQQTEKYNDRTYTLADLSLNLIKIKQPRLSSNFNSI
jgi:hypothetical protein